MTTKPVSGPDTVIRLENITKSYRGGDSIPALLEVCLTIHRGEFVFVTGASGSGKSTLIRLLTREIRATSGKIMVLGYDMQRIRRSQIALLRRRMGIVFQDFRLLEDRSLLENTMLAMKVTGAGSARSRKRARDILERMGLSGREKARPLQLSGGEQQKAALARALMNSPALLLADEPTGNLDMDSAMEIMDLLTEAHRAGATVLVVTHNMEIVEKVGGRLIRLDHGRVVYDSGPAERREDP